MDSQENTRESIERNKLNIKLSAAMLFASGITFFIFNTIAEGSYPNYSVRTNALSDLGALGSPTALLWDGQLFVSGLFGFLGMYFLFFKSSWCLEKIKNRWTRNLTAVLFLLPFVGTMLASLFPENFVGAIHLFGAIIVFTLGGISAIYSYRLTKAPFRYFSVVLGLTSLGSASLLGLYSLFGFGLIERMVVYPYVIWGISFGGYLMTSTSS